MEGSSSNEDRKKEYVIISDDDDEANHNQSVSDRYHAPKKRKEEPEPGPSTSSDVTDRIYSSSSSDKTSAPCHRHVVARQPSLSNHATAVARQSSELPSTSSYVDQTDEDSDITITDERVTAGAASSNLNDLNEDDDPVITNVIENGGRGEVAQGSGTEPITWQLATSGSNLVRQYVHSTSRSGQSASRHRRRPTARRAMHRVRTREYGDFLSFVRDITNDGVIISPLSYNSAPVPERTQWGSSSSRRMRSYRGHIPDPDMGSAFRMYPVLSRQQQPNNDDTREYYDAVSTEERTEPPILRGISSASNRHAILTQTAHQEMLHMHNLRERITSLRRDLQNLNGLLTDSFQLLHRIVPPRNSLPCIDKEVLDRVPTKLASESDISNPDRTCSICLAQYKAGESLRVLPCSHEFHEYCVDRWLTSCSRNCPFCRDDVQEALISDMDVT